jgi:hypothetical protein
VNLGSGGFAQLTDKQLRRVHTSVHALEKDLRYWITNWRNDQPFAWTKTPTRSSTASPHILDEFPARFASIAFQYKVRSD